MSLPSSSDPGSQMTAPPPSASVAPPRTSNAVVTSAAIPIVRRLFMVVLLFLAERGLEIASETASPYVAANDTADACDMLGDFINEVNAQTSKKISTAQAASFISQAQDIEAALGC